uniref:Pentatricopeptide repeat-containing protein n=1 Tax=Brassica oleracea TaxID=3712 RepID=A0A3P6AVT3_BRAOL|nr:unnamed protein product [Brassica oleracea]
MFHWDMARAFGYPFRFGLSLFGFWTSPDRHYSMWIQSCGCLNDLDGVEKVVQEMKGDSSWDTFANLASI